MSVAGSARFPWVPAYAVFEHYLVGLRRTWRAGVFSSFLLPVLTVLGFGVGVGAYIDQGVGGVPYLDWLVPGLIASTALQVRSATRPGRCSATSSGSRPTSRRRASPLRVGDIVAGHLAFVLFRVLTSIAAFLLVAGLFGALRSPWALATLPVVALLGLAVAAPTFAYAASVSSDSWLAMLFRFAVIPMTLFAGVFFPVESLPDGAALAGVRDRRCGTASTCAARPRSASPPQWSVAGHLLYLAAWAVAGWLLAVRAFRRKLVV